MIVHRWKYNNVICYYYSMIGSKLFYSLFQTLPTQYQCLKFITFFYSLSYSTYKTVYKVYIELKIPDKRQTKYINFCFTFFNLDGNLLIAKNLLTCFSPGVNFINILRAHFLYKSLLSSFSLLWTNFCTKNEHVKCW